MILCLKSRLIKSLLACQDGWSSFNNNCYRLFTAELLSWDEGSKLCNLNDATLASIHSKEENDFVATVTGPDTGGWIGGRRNGTWPDPNFYWTDKSEFDYINWKSTRHRDDCIRMGWRSGGWVANNCFAKAYPVCKSLS